MATRTSFGAASATSCMSSPGERASLPQIEALIESGGQIMLGTAKPIVGAAVAHDGKKTLVMLKRQPGESVHLLLSRLDKAIETALNTGTRVDEINKPNSDVSYSYRK